nr:hypothetical protein [Rhizobium binae]
MSLVLQGAENAEKYLVKADGNGLIDVNGGITGHLYRQEGTGHSYEADIRLMVAAAEGFQP